jgi:hypothetical protein
MINILTLVEAGSGFEYLDCNIAQGPISSYRPASVAFENKENVALPDNRD